ncbi:hypothetical protein BESB_009310 [Besnoitia besnoiti]|uniref:Uncharacterized protein n=1 Tax=Besnoitia besnoiti TaxID=94643 RepID=A0A2A9MKV6_BESBE|nr:hypothetical protein BESB_009310 [Besnoitia besnoiti]PFH38589.1 hypothetical protein BESB_009310 [Besnoitia besnoiti]
MQPSSLKRGRQQLPRGAAGPALAAASPVLQQMGSAKNISAVYNRVIEATIERCTQFQSAKVMDAIEKQWRLALQRRTAELRRAPAAAPVGGDSSSHQPRGTAADSSRTAASGIAPAAAPPAGPPQSAQSGGDAKSSAAAAKASGGQPSSPKVTKPADKAAEAVEAPADAPAKSEPAGDGGAEAADDDDDFEDADVDEAETLSATLSEGPAASASSSHTQAHAPSNDGSADASGHSRPELEEKEEILDDVSDLDDQEPAATDGIYALYERVERCGSSGKKTTNWRVTLRHGIIRAGRQEIAFDRLYGELKF